MVIIILLGLLICILLQMQDKDAGAEIFPWKTTKVVEMKQKPSETNAKSGRG